MLLKLTINDYVLIKHANIDLKPGFSSILGETGAGKSLIMGAIKLLMGKSSKNMPQKTVITALFHIPANHHVGQLFDDHGYVLDDTTQVLIKRVMNNGKSKFFINDSLSSRDFIVSLSDYLIADHSQLERFLDPSKQLQIIDRNNNKQLKLVNEKYNQYKITCDEITQLKVLLDADNVEEIKEKINDINSLDFEQSEGDLIDRRKFLKQQQQQLGSVIKAQETIATIDKNMNELVVLLADNAEFNDITSLHHDFNDLSYRIQSLPSFINMDELDEIDAKISQLRSCARKYNCLSSQLLIILEKAQHELAKINEAKIRINELTRLAQQQREQYLIQARILSESRQRFAKTLQNKIHTHFMDLGLEHANVEIRFNELAEQSWSHHGIDQVSFWLKSNKGTQYAPINQIASGGEYNRITLALKIELYQDIGVLLLDEIDGGTSGISAMKIGLKLQRLAKDKQIIAITHSPQVASCSDNQILVYKDHSSDESVTHIKIIDTIQEKTELIAKMMTGLSTPSQQAKIAAQKLQNELVC